MTKSEILERLTEIFHSVFDDENIILTPESTADDIEEWDSLNQIKLIIQAQVAFAVQLDARHINSLHNIGEMVEYIDSRLNTSA